MTFTDTELSLLHSACKTAAIVSVQHGHTAQAKQYSTLAGKTKNFTADDLALLHVACFAAACIASERNTGQSDLYSALGNKIDHEIAG